MITTIQQLSDQTDMPHQYAANVVAEVENRARWIREQAQINDDLEIAEEDGD
jgi:hypothetical protein